MNLDLEYLLDDQIKKLIETIEDGCKKFEEETNTDVILLLMSPDWATIDRDVVDDLWMHIRKRTFSKNEISVVLHSTGGDADAAYHLSIIFNSITKEKKLKFVIPRMAKSAATILACSGDSIIMSEISELGPVDPQIQTRTGRWISVTTVRDSLYEVFAMLEKRTNLSSICMDALFRTIPIIEVGQFGKLNEYINDLLFRSLHRQIKSGELTEEAAKRICEKLTGGYKYHGMPITKDEARKIGLNVENLPENIEEILMEKIYNPFKAIIKTIEEVIAPILSNIPFPIFMSKKIETKFGLIYVPPVDFMKGLESGLTRETQ